MNDRSQQLETSMTNATTTTKTVDDLCVVLRSMEDFPWCQDAADFLEALQRYCSSHLINPQELLDFMAEKEMEAGQARSDA